jgi:uncharacterized protein (DUF1800 family)
MLLAILAFERVRTQAQDPNANIYGTWKNKAFAGSVESFGLSDRLILALIGSLSSSAQKSSLVSVVAGFQARVLRRQQVRAPSSGFRNSRPDRSVLLYLY